MEAGRLTTQHSRGCFAPAFVSTTSARTDCSTVARGVCCKASRSAWGWVISGRSHGNGFNKTVPDSASRSAETAAIDGPIAGCTSRVAAKSTIPARAIPAATPARLRDTSFKRTGVTKVPSLALRSKGKVSVARASLDVRALQAPIRERYKREPQAAQIRLRVRSGPSDLGDPLHCAVVPESAPAVSWRSGAHPAVGGSGDVPCSGDVLLGALAACQETTLRMVAANMGIELESLEVEIEADWDARGTLAMGDYPIGLTAIRCKTRVTVPHDVRGERAERLLRSAEKYCVVLNTLRNGVPVASSFALAQRPSRAEI